MSGLDEFDVGDPAPQFVSDAWLAELNTWHGEDAAPFDISFDPGQVKGEQQ